MRVVFVFAFGLLAAACGQGAHVTLEPSDDLVEATQEAIEVWRPTLESCGRWLSLSYDHPDAIIEWGDTQGNLGLTFHSDPARVHVKTGAFDEDRALLVRTLSHELGHVLGADDTDDPSDLMYRDWTGGTYPDTNDVRQVCSH